MRDEDPGTGSRARARNHERGRGRTTLALLSVVILLAVPLTGCTDDGDTAEQEGPRTMTAQDGIGFAQAVAEDWEDADLGAIVTREGAEEPERWSEDAFEYVQDTAVGDGESPQWAYIYVVGNNETRAVYANVAGETYVQSEQQSPFERITGDWQLDSTDAIAAAREDENFTSVLRAQDAVVQYTLVQPQEEGSTPVWWLQVSSDSMEEGHTVFVDSQSGETHSPSRERSQ